jgi:hypothetical protein
LFNTFVDAASAATATTLRDNDDRKQGGQTRRVRGAKAESASAPGRRKVFEYDSHQSIADGYGGSGGVTKQLTGELTMRPTNKPVPAPNVPSPPPTPRPAAPRNITFIPGKLNVMERNLILSQGLTSKIIALSGRPVVYADSSTSVDNFHPWPDGGDTFIDNRPSNPGGFIYVSNSGVENGGVGTLTFDRNGGVIEYKMVARNTRYNRNVRNCGTDCRSRGGALREKSFTYTTCPFVSIPL